MISNSYTWEKKIFKFYNLKQYILKLHIQIIYLTIKHFIFFYKNEVLSEKPSSKRNNVILFLNTHTFLNTYTFFQPLTLFQHNYQYFLYQKQV